MGYIMMKAPYGMPQGDPKWNRIGTICLVIWLVGILIISQIESDNIILSIICIVWGAIPFVLIGLFILFMIIGIALYQVKIHFPTLFYKLPEWLKKLC